MFYNTSQDSRYRLIQKNKNYFGKIQKSILKYLSYHNGNFSSNISNIIDNSSCNTSSSLNCLVKRSYLDRALKINHNKLTLIAAQF